MASVFDVAKYILQKTETVSTFKLQKLVYYSQVWSLIWDDKPLFNNKIFAWANGPVCKDLYDFHKGRFDICNSNLTCGDEACLSEREMETIDVVIDSYNKYSSQELSEITHDEDPWKNARKGLSFGERGDKEITLDSIVEYYSSKYSKQIRNE